MSHTKLQFKHDFDPESGHEIELTIKCRLGAAPGLLRQLIDTSIEPLAERYDPHYQPPQLPMQPEDDPLEEPSRFPFVNEDDPNKPGAGDQF